MLILFTVFCYESIAYPDILEINETNVLFKQGVTPLYFLTRLKVDDHPFAHELCNEVVEELILI